jgi:ribonucleoside-triphosphate reductase
MGNPCIILDREPASRIAACGCLASEDPGAGEPWRRRCASLQNVTLNLPRLGYRAWESDDERLFTLLDEVTGLAVKAHLQKRSFIEKLLSLGDAGPLAMLATPGGGLPSLSLEEATCLIGVAGLNELVQIRRGKQLHESPAALEWGLALMGRLERQARRLGEIHGLNLLLEQTPAETTAYRFARLDLKQFSPLPGRFVRGNLARGEIYYTNSTHLHPGAAVDPLDRVRMEGRFHPLFRAGAVTHIELGDAEPAASDLVALLVRAFRETCCNQVVFSPEFTSCQGCGATTRGLRDRCGRCGSAEVKGLARITQYMSWVSGWNRGKSAELRDRRRHGPLT